MCWRSRWSSRRKRGRTGDLGVLEVEVEFKENEHVDLIVLEVEMEFKEEERKNR